MDFSRTDEQRKHLWPKLDQLACDQVWLTNEGYKIAYGSGSARAERGDVFLNAVNLLPSTGFQFVQANRS